MVTKIWVNIGSGNDLLPDGTKPLSELIDFSSMEICGINLRTVSHELLKILMHKLYLWNYLHISRGPVS